MGTTGLQQTTCRLHTSSVNFNLEKMVKVGDTFPDVTIQYGFPPEAVSMKERLAGKKSLVVGLPGAFTPT